MGDRQYLAIAYHSARYHHEKWNGESYPDELKRIENMLEENTSLLAPNKKILISAYRDLDQPFYRNQTNPGKNCREKISPD